MEIYELRPGYIISRIIKGGWQLAGGHGSVDRKRAIGDMRAFINAGITTFDCADIYTGVETMIGDFIAENRRACENAGVKVHTKLVPNLDRLHSLSARDVEVAVDRSLKRLRVEQLDLVQFFWWDLGIGHPIEAMSYLAKMQENGKIDQLGITNWDAAGIAPFVDAGMDVVCAQVQYSMLDARPSHGLSEWCAGHDIGLICYGVLAGGFLTPHWLGKAEPGFEFSNRSLVKYRLVIDEFGGWDLFQALLTTLDSIAGQHNVTLDAVAARYMLEQPQVAAVIIGARYAAHLRGTLAIEHLKLGTGDLARIDAILRQRHGPRGAVYGLESQRGGRHGKIMKYNLNV